VTGSWQWGAGAAESDSGAGGVAVVAPFLAGVALVALGRGVDGGLASPAGGRDGDDGPGLAVGAGPGGLAAAVGAENVAGRGAGTVSSTVGRAARRPRCAGHGRSAASARAPRAWQGTAGPASGIAGRSARSACCCRRATTHLRRREVLRPPVETALLALVAVNDRARVRAVGDELTSIHTCEFMPAGPC